MLTCRYCGWQYDPAEHVGKPGVRFDPYKLVPRHPMQPAGNPFEPCSGGEQYAHNPDGDCLPLRKDLDPT